MSLLRNKTKQVKNIMTDQIVTDFVDAANAGDDAKMLEVISSTSQLPFDQVLATVEKIIVALNEDEKDHDELVKSLEVQVETAKMAKQYQEQLLSGGAEGTEDNSKPEEVTQDVAADTTAETAKESLVVEEGNGPAEEEKEDKSADKE